MTNGGRSAHKHWNIHFAKGWIMARALHLSAIPRNDRAPIPLKLTFSIVIWYISKQVDSFFIILLFGCVPSTCSWWPFLPSARFNSQPNATCTSIFIFPGGFDNPWELMDIDAYIKDTIVSSFLQFILSFTTVKYYDLYVFTFSTCFPYDLSSRSRA